MTAIAGMEESNLKQAALDDAAQRMGSAPVVQDPAPQADVDEVRNMTIADTMVELESRLAVVSKGLAASLMDVARIYVGLTMGETRPKTVQGADGKPQRVLEHVPADPKKAQFFLEVAEKALELSAKANVASVVHSAKKA